MQDGLAHVFMARLNRLTAVRGTTMAHLSGLREVTVVTSGAGARSVPCRLALEPSLIALGASHLAVVAHTKACLLLSSLLVWCLL